MKKKLALWGGGIVLGLFAIALLINVLLGRIVKTAVQTLGPQMTQSEVRVGWVMVSPFLGRARVRRLYVGNPPGFKTDFAIRVKKFTAEVKTSSMFSNTIVVNRVEIEKPELSYEAGDRGTNLDAIQKNIESYVGASNAKASDPSAKSPKKVIIRDLVIRDAHLIWSPKLISGPPIEVAVPEIHLQHIGESSGGVSPADAASQILGKITMQSSAAVMQTAGKVAVGAKESAKQFSGGLKKLFGGK